MTSYEEERHNLENHKPKLKATHTDAMETVMDEWWIYFLLLFFFKGTIENIYY